MSDDSLKDLWDIINSQEQRTDWWLLGVGVGEGG